MTITTDWTRLQGPYSTITADPPWMYGSKGPAGRGRMNPLVPGGAEIIQPDSVGMYGGMTMDELIALPVKYRTTENAHCYLWTTNSFLDEAFDLMKAWGFKYKTTITWGKIKVGLRAEPSMKMGHYFRGATEHCLFGVKGKLKLLTDEGVATLQLSERLPHSVKPDWFYELVEKCSPGPRLEIFCRRPRAGWDAFGDEGEKMEQAAKEDPNLTFGFNIE